MFVCVNGVCTWMLAWVSELVQAVHSCVCLEVCLRGLVLRCEWVGVSVYLCVPTDPGSDGVWARGTNAKQTLVSGWQAAVKNSSRAA